MLVFVDRGIWVRRLQGHIETSERATILQIHIHLLFRATHPLGSISEMECDAFLHLCFCFLGEQPSACLCRKDKETYRECQVLCDAKFCHNTFFTHTNLNLSATFDSTAKIHVGV